MLGSDQSPSDQTPEDAAFDRMYRDEHIGLLRFAYLVCGDHHQAEEAVADALARTWPRWRKGDIADPRAYVRRAIVNEIRGQFRRTGVRRRHEDRRHVDLEARFVDDDAIERDFMHQALLQLPVRQRVVVVLRIYEDRSERETADLMGVSPGTVKTHLHRAMEQLRALLEEDQ
jgi:RNA polymerase sigma-70 factor (sigma-E family)